MPPKKTDNQEGRARRRGRRAPAKHRTRDRRDDHPHQRNPGRGTYGGPGDSAGDRAGLWSDVGRRGGRNRSWNDFNVRQSGTTITATATNCGGANQPACTGLSPLLQKGREVSWWFVFKFNSKVFPGCGGSAKTGMFVWRRPAELQEFEPAIRVRE